MEGKSRPVKVMDDLMLKDIVILFQGERFKRIHKSRVEEKAIGSWRVEGPAIIDPS